MKLESYRELRKPSPLTAKQKVLEWAQTHRPGQIAALLAKNRTPFPISSPAIGRRDLEGLADRRRCPHFPAGQTDSATEKIVVLEPARTVFGPAA